MQTVTIQITNENAIKALHYLQEKRFIKILHQKDKSFFALPGKAMSADEFENWIAEAEKCDTISIKDAKTKWERKRNQIIKHLM